MDIWFEFNIRLKYIFVHNSTCRPSRTYLSARMNGRDGLRERMCDLTRTIVFILEVECSLRLGLLVFNDGHCQVFITGIVNT